MVDNVQILVVDDEELVRGVTLRRLASLGYSTIEAATADEALAVLSDGTPVDLLLTDMVMPGSMHGVDLARAARRMRPSLKILFSSGYFDDSLHREVIEGGTHLLSKPCSKAELAEKIREVLGLSSTSH